MTLSRRSCGWVDPKSGECTIPVLSDPIGGQVDHTMGGVASNEGMHQDNNDNGTQVSMDQVRNDASASNSVAPNGNRVVDSGNNGTASSQDEVSTTSHRPVDTNNTNSKIESPDEERDVCGMDDDIHKFCVPKLMCDIDSDVLRPIFTKNPEFRSVVQIFIEREPRYETFCHSVDQLEDFIFWANNRNSELSFCVLAHAWLATETRSVAELIRPRPYLATILEASTRKVCTEAVYPHRISLNRIPFPVLKRILAHLGRERVFAALAALRDHKVNIFTPQEPAATDSLPYLTLYCCSLRLPLCELLTRIDWVPKMALFAHFGQLVNVANDTCLCCQSPFCFINSVVGAGSSIETVVSKSEQSSSSSIADSKTNVTPATTTTKTSSETRSDGWRQNRHMRCYPVDIKLKDFLGNPQLLELINFDSSVRGAISLMRDQVGPTIIFDQNAYNETLASWCATSELRLLPAIYLSTFTRENDLDTLAKCFPLLQLVIDAAKQNFCTDAVLSSNITFVECPRKIAANLICTVGRELTFVVIKSLPLSETPLSPPFPNSHENFDYLGNYCISLQLRVRDFLLQVLRLDTRGRFNYKQFQAECPELAPALRSALLDFDSNPTQTTSVPVTSSSSLPMEVQTSVGPTSQATAVTESNLSLPIAVQTPSSAIPSDVQSDQTLPHDVLVIDVPQWLLEKFHHYNALEFSEVLVTLCQLHTGCDIKQVLIPRSSDSYYTYCVPSDLRLVTVLFILAKKQGMHWIEHCSEYPCLQNVFNAIDMGRLGYRTHIPEDARLCDVRYIDVCSFVKQFDKSSLLRTMFHFSDNQTRLPLPLRYESTNVDHLVFYCMMSKARICDVLTHISTTEAPNSPPIKILSATCSIFEKVVQLALKNLHKPQVTKNILSSTNSPAPASFASSSESSCGNNSTSAPTPKKFTPGESPWSSTQTPVKKEAKDKSIDTKSESDPPQSHVKYRPAVQRFFVGTDIPTDDNTVAQLFGPGARMSTTHESCCHVTFTMDEVKKRYADRTQSKEDEEGSNPKRAEVFYGQYYKHDKTCKLDETHRYIIASVVKLNVVGFAERLGVGCQPHLIETLMELATCGKYDAVEERAARLVNWLCHEHSVFTVGDLIRALDGIAQSARLAIFQPFKHLLDRC